MPVHTPILEIIPDVFQNLDFSDLRKMMQNSTAKHFEISPANIRKFNINVIHKQYTLPYLCGTVFSTWVLVRSNLPINEF